MVIACCFGSFLWADFSQSIEEAFFMTINQKLKIDQMRENGQSLQAISEELSISLGTIKSYLSRKSSVLHCSYCRQTIHQQNHRKKKRFCSDRCRMSWWREHCESSDKTIEKICPICKKKFFSYPSKSQIYCSKQCAGKARWTHVSQHHDVSDNG